jgi:class 3 adenylate cyclase
VIVVAGRVWFDTPIGLWTLVWAIALHGGLVALEVTGVLQAHALFPDKVDLYYAEPTGHLLAFGWIVVVYVLAWTLAGLAALRYRESEHSLTVLNASLEQRVASQVADLERANRLRRYLAPQVVEQLLATDQPMNIERARRPLTVFFCDLKGFTPLVERLDASDLAELLNRYLDLVATVAFEHGGTVDKFIGDAAMVFFGAPRATTAEDQATRCVRMAIDIQTRLAPLREEALRRWDFDMGVRMGIASGLATVGDFGANHRMEFTAVGSPVNRAARLEPQAPPGTILVDQATQGLARLEGVAFESFGALTLKGFADPVPAWRVVTASIGGVE